VVSSLQTGEVLAGRFVIEHPVGKGGMGVVFRALDRITLEPVALKVLRNREGDARRFEREARVLSELSHDAIVRYVAHGVTPDGDPWLAMEWLPGEDLASWLEAHALTPRAALVLASRVASALAAAHALGVVHRDIKPANLLLPDGDPSRVKVLDFGIARRTNQVAHVATGTGVLIGTPGYLAPEQARGDKGILGADGRMDRMADGGVVFAANGATTDEASRAARLALALRERLPDRVIAVAAGQAPT